MTTEHIIPLSLGGSNQFCIKVNNEYNKILGSKIDGKLSNDYMISCLRRKNDLRGHSNLPPITKLTNVRIKESNMPVQLIFAKDSKWVYDLMTKKVLSENESAGREYSINMKFDRHIRSLFVAKTALAAGYFVYGDLFLHEADHQSVRNYMNFAIHGQTEKVGKLNLRLIDQFDSGDDEMTRSLHSYFKIMFKILNCSAVKIVLCSEHFLVSVAISGEYIGTINFKANPKAFPNKDKFSGGQVLGIQSNALKTSSFDYIEDRVNKLILKKHYA